MYSNAFFAERFDQGEEELCRAWGFGPSGSQIVEVQVQCKLRILKEGGMESLELHRRTFSEN